VRLPDEMWPNWVNMVLGPFAKTKGSRPPGRHPALPNTKIKPQQIEKNENIIRRNDFIEGHGEIAAATDRAC